MYVLPYTFYLICWEEETIIASFFLQKKTKKTFTTSTGVYRGVFTRVKRLLFITWLIRHYFVSLGHIWDLCGASTLYRLDHFLLAKEYTPSATERLLSRVDDRLTGESPTNRYRWRRFESILRTNRDGDVRFMHTVTTLYSPPSRTPSPGWRRRRLGTSGCRTVRFCGCFTL